MARLEIQRPKNLSTINTFPPTRPMEAICIQTTTILDLDYPREDNDTFMFFLSSPITYFFDESLIFEGRKKLVKDPDTFLHVECAIACSERDIQFG